MTVRVKTLRCWEALDSRGTPTVAAEVGLVGGGCATAIVPSGASTGRHEAHELRDGGTRYGGRGVQTAVRSVLGEINAGIRDVEVDDQVALDGWLRELDGTPTLSRLGANAVLAVSLACLLAAADRERVPLYRWLHTGSHEVLLPLPMVNIISGGAHAHDGVDIQDLLVIPVGAGSFAEALEWAWRVRAATVAVAERRDVAASLVADEGGIGPALPSTRAALELLTAGLEGSGLVPGQDVVIAIDVAAGQLVHDSGYELAREGRVLDGAAMVAEVAGWCADFPIVSVEDPMADDDWTGWRLASSRLRGIQLVGDDLFATNRGRLQRGLAEGVASAVLVKPNQAGTLSEAREVLETAQAAGYATVVSARSGDTEQSWLADLAVGWRAGQVKVGSTMRSERTSKWNRLLQIEAELEGQSVFAGRAALGLIEARP